MRAADQPVGVTPGLAMLLPCLCLAGLLACWLLRSVIDHTTAAEAGRQVSRPNPTACLSIDFVHLPIRLFVI